MSEDRSTTGVRAADVVGTLVAISILGIVAIFLFWPVTSTVGSGRRNTCANNLRNIGLAMLNYESSQRAFPGYANRISNFTTSFVLPLTPYLERRDIYITWTDPASEFPRSVVFIDWLVCPSEQPADRKSPWLAYVVNSGEAGRENAADGICFDQTQPDAPTVSLSDIANKDGAGNTVLLSENLQAETWTVKNATAARAWTTFVWHTEEPVDANWKINSAFQNGAPALTFSRPSSKHVGGVNVVFCDGHLRFIAEDIDYKVYRQLMTPDGTNSRNQVNVEIKDGDY